MRTSPFIDHGQNDFEVIRESFNWNVPPRMNLARVLCDKHSDEPSRVAMLYEDADGATQTMTFGMLIETSNRFANVLESLGVRPSDRVAVILSQKPETAITHLAIYKLGAIALPLSCLFQKDALKYRLQNCEAKVAVVAQEDASEVREIARSIPELEKLIVIGKHAKGEISFWDSIQRASSTFACADTSADDPALLLYTSGTTGPPKGCLFPHRFMLGIFPGFELSHNFFPKEGDIFWSPADWAWGGGLFDCLFPCLFYGVPILAYRMPKFDPERALYMLGKHGVRNTFIFPTALRMMSTTGDIRKKYSMRLRSIVTGGEIIGPEVLDWAKDEFGIIINEHYGQTEADYVVGNCSAIMRVKPQTLGKPYPGHVVDIIDEQGTSLKPGEVGELVIQSSDPVMFLGYWRNEAATRERFRGDWWLTGDMMKRDEEGYLYYVGRKDDTISSAGYRIGPSEIETCLAKYPAVAQVAIIGSPDRTRGEIIKAFIRLEDHHEPSDRLKRKIQEHVKKNLAYYQYPREVEFIANFPTTTSGKINRSELKRMELENKTVKVPGQ